MNRRDFLHPRHLAQTTGQLLAALAEPSARPPADTTDAPALLRASRRAMATVFEVVLPFGTPNAVAAVNSALDEIDRLEDQLTVYRDTSEVSALNRHAAAGAVTVSENLFELLRLAARLTRETEGAFDVTAGALIKAWGFYRGPRRVPTPLERWTARQRVGMHLVQLDAHERTVRYLRDGIEINLGSIGKGYALDEVGRLLRSRWGVTSGVVHGGHSSVLAIGTPPTNPMRQQGDHPSERGWKVGVAHPWEPRRVALLHLRDRALGTSAATFQHLEYNGRKLGHILDPRSGWPAEGLASVSVTAPTAAEADALATAFFILGVDWAREYCAAHPDVGAILLPQEGDLVIAGRALSEAEEVSAGTNCS
jgi:thiamine biosynthesis lipoprotein